MKSSFACSWGAAALVAALAFCAPAHAQNYQLTDLGSLVDGGSVRGHDLNNLGQVVGWAEFGSPGATHRRAFVYDGIGGMRTLGDASWDEFMFDSFAGAINDAGLIAGGTGWGYRYPQWRQQAFMIDSSGTLVSGIGAPDPLLAGQGDGNANTDLSFFRGMTEDGQIWGTTWIDQGDGGYMHYLTGSAGVGLTLDIEPLNGGLLNTINPLAASFSVDGLNAANLLGSDHRFVQVVDINDRGQILAWATDQRSYLVTPVPEPATWALMLAGLGAVGAARKRRRQAD